MRFTNRKYKNLTNNTLLFAISSFGTKILSFFLVPLYTDILSPSEYGIADILCSTVTLLIVVLTINIADGVLIFSMDKEFCPTRILSYGIKRVFDGCIVLALICICIRFVNILKWPTYYYVFIFLLFLTSAVYQVFSNYLRAIEKVKEVAIVGVISSFVYILSNIFFLLIVNIGLYGYLTSLVVGPSIGLMCCLIVIKPKLKDLVHKFPDNNQKKAILNYCFPLIFNSIALWINSCLDRYFVASYCGIAENGIYSIASKIPLILAVFYTVFSQAWTLSAVKEFDSEDKDGFFANTYAIYNASMCIVCSLLILFNVPLAKILYRNEFFEAWNYSSILILGVFFNSLTAFVGSIFSAKKKSNVLASTTIISAVVNTCLNVVLIPICGVIGAAISTTVSLLIMWVIRMIKLRELIYLKVDSFKDIFAYILLAVQVIIEHTENHLYLGQILIVITLMILYGNKLMTIIKPRN